MRRYTPVIHQLNVSIVTLRLPWDEQKSWRQKETSRTLISYLILYLWGVQSEKIRWRNNVTGEIIAKLPPSNSSPLEILWCDSILTWNLLSGKISLTSFMSAWIFYARPLKLPYLLVLYIYKFILFDTQESSYEAVEMHLLERRFHFIDSSTHKIIWEKEFVLVG